MANASHLGVLCKGASAWNQWRDENPNLEPDLSNIDLCQPEIAGNAWDGINQRVNLSEFNLANTDLTRCNLTGAKLWNGRLQHARLRWANLSGADLFGAKLAGADCYGANLEDAVLSKAALTKADLNSANLRRSTCIGTSFSGADVTAADFTSADLRGVEFKPWQVSLMGAPIIPMEYPETDVSYLFGLSGSARRLVGSAQYIRQRWVSARGWKMALRFWGISCGYGRSLIRWSILSLFAIVCFAWTFTAIDMYFAVRSIDTIVDKSGGSREVPVSGIGRPSAEDALYFSVVTFTTLGFGDIAPVSVGGKLMVVIEVIIGYAMLGALVSILANRLLVSG